MFKKILIANRGEIALRVIWACQELGIRTVAVYSEADKDSLHIRFSDEDVCIGPPKNSESYLNIPSLISAAEITNADALHPGYGFLAENAQFAEICEECNIHFIGPSPAVIREMGDKARARAIMRKAGIPVIPGSDGCVKNVDEAAKIAQKIGYPVILKAAAGGGGRGMRVARNEEEIVRFFGTAEAEASSFFSRPDLYLEKYLESPRHIEFQIIGDKHGNIVQLGERECSIQRRHQKLIEESPSVVLDPKLRKKMADAALKVVKTINYVSVGTVEFLLDAKKNFYFLEMNTRIQVEHPVTELVTGLDLVREQILVAMGKKLSFAQKDVVHRGHSIECRINAEDPETFAPCPGTIETLHLPGGAGVRVDTAAYSQCKIPPYYDSLIAKLIVYRRNREEAIRTMKRALRSFIVEGIKTTIPFHLKILDSEEFQAGEFNTKFLEHFMQKPQDA
jgi:acetyl-CoA carboxylase biotin carboxylase subunit